MASSANQQEQINAQQTADAAGHSLAMQRQQQELVKLLAQHFHHQFYQLAASSNNGNSTQQLLATNSSSNAATNSTRLQQQPPLPAPMQAAYRQQPPGAHYANETSLQLGASGCGFDLNGMNLVASNQMLHNHILRSQVTTTSTTAHDHPSRLASSGGAIASASAQESLLDFSLRNSLNPYPLNDMNLFHALGLNLTNNQLVLSLQQQQQQQHQQQKQQQSLVHQASCRQYSINNEVLRNDEIVVGGEEEEDEMHPPAIGHHWQNSDGTTRPNQSIDHDGSNHTDGKEMLKFSINTILGKGPPNHHPSCVGFESPFKAASAISNQSLDRKSNSSLQDPHHNQANELFKIKTRNNNLDERNSERGDDDDDELISTGADCDDSNDDSCSDSSSLINAASSPTPRNTSILFTTNNQQQQQLNPLINHHRSAHNNININNNNSAGPQSINLNQPAPLPPPARNHTLQAPHHQLHNHHHPLPFLPGSSAFPWTVAARGKPRRGMMRRAVFSDSQRVGLEKRFQLQKYISKPDRKKLAEKLGLRDSQVKIWFQNRRMKWRNSKERELLSAGGSREQTLPTRNNPNPDLSDVGETIKRLTTTTTTTSTTATTTNNTTTKNCPPTNNCGGTN